MRLLPLHNYKWTYAKVQSANNFSNKFFKFPYRLHVVNYNTCLLVNTSVQRNLKLFVISTVVCERKIADIKIPVVGLLLQSGNLIC